MGTGIGYSDAIHDALAVASVIDPAVIEKEVRCRCDVDINGGAADGELITDKRLGYEADDRVKTRVALKGSKEKFFALLLERLGEKKNGSHVR